MYMTARQLCGKMEGRRKKKGRKEEEDSVPDGTVYVQHQYSELFVPETGFPENAEHGGPVVVVMVAVTVGN